MRIRSHLILIVAAVVLPLIGMLWYSIQLNFEHAKKEAHTLIALESDLLATNVSTQLGKLQQRLEYLASLPEPTLLDPDRCDPA